MSAGQSDPTLTHHSIVAIGKIVNVLGQSGQPCHLFHAATIGLVATETDILLDRGGKQERLLRGKPDLPPQRRKAPVIDIDIVDEQLSTWYFV